MRWHARVIVEASHAWRARRREREELHGGRRPRVAEALARARRRRVDVPRREADGGGRAVDDGSAQGLPLRRLAAGVARRMGWSS